MSVGQWRTQDLAKERGHPQPLETKGVWGHKKELILAHLFIEKEHTVSTVTMDNEKIFPQLMSKSRNLDKISEKRRQLLLG